MLACPLAGSTTGEPAYTARMTLDGPGGSVAVQLPSWPVFTDVASVKAFEPSSGAVRIAIGWLASGRPALLTSSPRTLTG